MKTSAWMLGLLLFSLAGEAGENLLANPGFGREEGEAVPAGWTAYGEGMRGPLSGDSGLVLGVEGEGRTLGLRQRVELPPARPAATRLSARVETEDLRRGKNSWHSGRLMLTYLDAEGRELGDAFGYDRLEGDLEAQWVSRQFPVPPGAAAVEVDVGLLNAASGRLNVSEIRLEALTEAEARAWRAAADARIRAHRMADLTVRVVDASGAPVEDARVAVRMRRHAYAFGSAVKASFLLEEDPDPDLQRYQAVVTNFFNLVSIENALKDRFIERDGLDRAVDAVDWLHERGLRVRGHTLIWPSWRQTPEHYRKHENEPTALRAVIRAAFERIMNPTRGKIEAWGVVNEPCVHNELFEVLGDEAIVTFFKWADELAPDADLYINENNLIFNAGNHACLRSWVRRLVEAEAGLDGIGFQGHMWHRTMPSGHHVLEDLARYDEFGLKHVLTEFSVNSRFSEEETARYLDELMHAWFSHPRTVGFMMWGFIDRWSWTRNGPLFRNDWSLKPSGVAWMERVYGDWWTEADLTTGPGGDATMRGFKGDYVVEARHAGRVALAELRLEADGRSLELRLPAEPGPGLDPLGSFNPYTGGKLPEVRAAPATGDAGADTRVVALGPDQGAWAAVPAPPEAPSDVLSLGESDVYLRFPVPAVPEGFALERAELELTATDAAEPTPRLSVYALSPRFLAGEGELGTDWDPERLRADNAPGRAEADGEFDLGDARVMYLGDLRPSRVRAGSRIVFTSVDLGRLASEAEGDTLTLILSASGGLGIAAPGHPVHPPPALRLHPRTPNP